MTGTSKGPVVLLTESDLATRYTGTNGEQIFTARQIRAWRKRGEGPTAVKLSGSWHYTLASVHAWEATLGIRPEFSSVEQEPGEQTEDDDA